MNVLEGEVEEEGRRGGASCGLRLDDRNGLLSEDVRRVLAVRSDERRKVVHEVEDPADLVAAGGQCGEGCDSLKVGSLRPSLA